MFCSLGAVVFAAGIARSDDFLAAFEELDADPGAFEDAVVLPGGFGPELLLAQDKIGDPAVETVDEMDRRGSSGGSSGSSSPLRDRWDKIRDPAIETVDEQTRKVDEKKEKKKEWYERINLRGYTQFRINSVLWNNEELAPPYHPGDRSVAPLNHFFIRRCRLIFSGDLSDRLFFYIQPDLAAGVPGATDGAINYAQLRDCYGDVYLTTNKVHRARVGLSKVPYGWENMQSSSNRIPLDRSDSFNSAVFGERQMGVFYYWTPEYAQDLYKEVLDEGLKGSGNYGVFGIGVYNGQGVSKAESNNNMHMVLRLNSPWKMPSGQIMEAGVQAYTGRYTSYTGPIKVTGFSDVTPENDPKNGPTDERIGATFVYYPQPLGFTTEWNTGNGNELGPINAPPTKTLITSQPLSGGYVLVNYKIDSEEWGTIFPFFRWQTYRGGYLWERNSPKTYMGNFNLGMEWQFTPQMELTWEYDWVNQTNTGSNYKIVNGEYAQFQGDLLRFQFQINY
ncbi:MAG: porin [Planctomycetia bacterium]